MMCRASPSDARLKDFYMKNTMIRALENRINLYSYAWRLFSHLPDDDLLELVASNTLGEEAVLLSGEEGKLANIQVRLQTAAGSAKDSLEALKSDYTKLFIGPTKLPAPPWESVYLAEADLIFQESTLEVREAYKEAGYKAAGYPHEADDYLATELNFMVSLNKDALAAYEADDTARAKAFLMAQSKFLANHLNRWLLAFAERLNERAPAGTRDFYPLAAYFAAELCAVDAENLEELLLAL